MYETILFDLGQVIVPFDLTIGLKRIAAVTDVSAEKIISFFKSEDERLFTEGFISADEFFAAAQKELRLSISKDEFADIYNSIFGRDEAMERFIRDLNCRYKLFLLSNTNSFHFPYIKKNYDILNIFDGYIVSYEVKCQKPDFEIFNILLQRLNTKPEKIFFVDDTEENVEAAESLGIKSFLYSGDVDALKRECRQLDII